MDVVFFDGWLGTNAGGIAGIDGGNPVQQSGAGVKGYTGIQDNFVKP